MLDLRALGLVSIVCSMLIAVGCSDVQVEPVQEVHVNGCCCKGGGTACCGDAGSSGGGGGVAADGGGGGGPAADGGGVLADGAVADTSDTCVCPEGYTPTPDGESCVTTLSTQAEQSGTTWRVCEGADGSSYSQRGTIYDGGSLSDVVSDHVGRLQDVGVWTCRPDGQGPWNTTSQGVCNPGGQTCTTDSDCAGNAYCEDFNWLPIEEWIGFSHCLQVEESGDYLIGMGADNAIRFYVNGQLEFAREWDHYSNNTMNHKNWFVEKVTLQAGPNFIRLEGFNDASIAAFGAEISGPFPPGSLDDQSSMRSVDYEGNLIFSTQDLVGEEVHTFDTGESSGFQCPDGYSLNTCGPEPICTKVIRVPCGVESGACCETGAAGSTCSQATEATCDGEFLGWGLTCNDPTVVEQCLGSSGADAGTTDTVGGEEGACCVRESTCIETSEELCAEQQGTFFGFGTSCSSPAVQEECGGRDVGTRDTGEADATSFDLAIDKSFGGVISVDSGGSFEVTISNQGPDAVSGPITFTDMIPDSDCLEVSGVNGQNWSCSGSQPTQCTYSGSLAAGSSTSVALRLKVKDPDLCGHAFQNCAEIQSPSDSSPTNNEDCDNTELSR